MDPLRALVPLLPIILPILGKLLLMIPFVPNKAIPAINTIVASVAKYWFLAGFGVLGEVPVPEPVGDAGTTIMMAGFLGSLGQIGLSIAWGALDQTMAHFFYEGERAKAKLLGKTSWFEQGKASIYGKKN